VTTGEGETQTPTEDLTQTPYVGTDKEFEIKSGEYLSTVANNLLSQGLIADKNEFIKTVESMGLANKVQVGKFTIPGGATYEEIAKIITKTR
jgi:cell division protein YceG involved in septum cleavage